MVIRWQMTALGIFDPARRRLIAAGPLPATSGSTIHRALWKTQCGWSSLRSRNIFRVEINVDSNGGSENLSGKCFAGSGARGYNDLWHH